VIIFAADDPLVLDGTYDREGYKPGERARIAKAQQRAKGLDDMAKKTKAGKTNGREKTSGRPRTQKQKALPGMEDHAIKPLENIAAEYAEIRDKRMELTREEHDLKANALKLMKKYGKTLYKHGGVTIQVVEGEPDVKVKIKKPGDEEEDAQAAGAEFAAERAAAVDGDEAEV
jgi:hypothetical protein